jgi:AGZA family xanthine/uracil permease-like MFS transporter
MCSQVGDGRSLLSGSAGVAEGGWSGLTAVVVGALLASIFVIPLASIVPFSATAPVLVLIGFLMAGLIEEVDLRHVRGLSGRCRRSASSWTS